MRVIASLVFNALCGFALAAGSSTAEEAPAVCPAEYRYDVAFTDDVKDDLVRVELNGACDKDYGAVLTLYVVDETGRQLLEFSPDFIHAASSEVMAKKAKRMFTPNTGAPTDRPTTHIEQMPPLADIDPVYFRVEDEDLYARARAIGGPILCFTSYDYGGVCAWYDADNKSAHILFEEGS